VWLHSAQHLFFDGGACCSQICLRLSIGTTHSAPNRKPRLSIWGVRPAPRPHLFRSTIFHGMPLIQAAHQSAMGAAACSREARSVRRSCQLMICTG